MPPAKTILLVDDDAEIVEIHAHRARGRRLSASWPRGTAMRDWRSPSARPPT